MGKDGLFPNLRGDDAVRGHLNENVNCSIGNSAFCPMKSAGLEAVSEQTWPYTATAIVTAFVWIVGCSANGIVVLAFATRRALLIQQPIFLLLFNLSVVDFLICLLGTPALFVSAINQSWAFGQTACNAYGFGMSVAGIANSCTLAVIAIERYRIMKRSAASPARARPFLALQLSSDSSNSSDSVSSSFPRSNSSNQRAKLSTRMILAVAFVWSYAVAVSLPPLFGWSGYVVEGIGFSCAPKWNTLEGGLPTLSYSLFLLLFAFCVPFAAVVTSYTLLVRHVGKSSMTGANFYERICRLRKLVALMITVFMATWMPYASFAIIVMLGYEDRIPAWLGSLPVVWCKLSIALNPFVYYFTVGSIRTAIRRTFRRLFCRRKRSSEGSSSNGKRKSKTTTTSSTQCRQNLRAPTRLTILSGIDAKALSSLSNSPNGRHSCFAVVSGTSGHHVHAKIDREMDDGGVWLGVERDVGEIAQPHVNIANV